MRDVFPPGLPDELFIRGKVPMTKSEVRAVTISKARLRDGLRILDIGAGTGSITVEAALLCPTSAVYAVERDAEALAVLARNLAHFALTNVHTLAGEAPEVLAGLAPVDRIFLGGSGGRMADLLAALPQCLRPGGRLVSNTIGLESTVEVMQALRQGPWREAELVQVAIARGAALGPVTRLEPLNPIFIVSATLAEG
jgi:cobalt-precorrin-6B (C15)-methyltransferase